jgi:hypothetical protein
MSDNDWKGRWDQILFMNRRWDRPPSLGPQIRQVDFQIKALEDDHPESPGSLYGLSVAVHKVEEHLQIHHDAVTMMIADLKKFRARIDQEKPFLVLGGVDVIERLQALHRSTDE